MAIEFRSSSNTGNDSNQTTRAPAVPAGAQPGDVMIAFLSRWQPGMNPTVTAPPGFVHVGQYLSGGDGYAKIDVYWKRLTAPDTGTYTFSWAGDMWSSVEIACFTGAAASGDPIAGVAAWAGTAGTFGATTVTTGEPPGLVWNSYNDTGAAGRHTPPTGFTEVVDVDCGSLAYRIPGTVGSHTASGATVSTSSPAAAVLVAVKPEPTTTAAAEATTEIPLAVAAAAAAETTHDTATSIPLSLHTDGTAHVEHHATAAITMSLAAHAAATAEAQVTTSIPLVLQLAPVATQPITRPVAYTIGDTIDGPRRRDHGITGPGKPTGPTPTGAATARHVAAGTTRRAMTSPGIRAITSTGAARHTSPHPEGLAVAGTVTGPAVKPRTVTGVEV